MSVASEQELTEGTERHKIKDQDQDQAQDEVDQGSK